MNHLPVRAVTVLFVLTLAIAGAVIYARKSDETGPIPQWTNDEDAVDVGAIPDEGSSAGIGITPSSEEPVMKTTPTKAKDPPSADTENLNEEEIQDNSETITQLTTEMDAFLRARYEARDDNPLPELMVWLEQRAEVANVSLTEGNSEILVTFKGGGAAAFPIGQ